MEKNIELIQSDNVLDTIILKNQDDLLKEKINQISLLLNSFKDSIKKQSFETELFFVQKLLINGITKFEEVDSIIRNLYTKIYLFSEEANSSYKEKHKAPVSDDFYHKIMSLTGRFTIEKKDIRSIQFKMIFTLLNYSSVRINDIRLLKLEDFIDIIENGYFLFNNEKYFVLEEGVLILKRLLPEYKQLFIENGYFFLGSCMRQKNNTYPPLNKLKFISLINKELLKLCTLLNVPPQTTQNFRSKFFVDQLKTGKNVKELAQESNLTNIKNLLEYKSFIKNEKTNQYF